MIENVFAKGWFDIKGSLPQKLNINLKDGCVRLLGLIRCQPWTSCCLSGLKSMTKTFLLASHLLFLSADGCWGACSWGQTGRSLPKGISPKPAMPCGFCQRREGELLEEWLNVVLDFLVTVIQLYIIPSIFRLRDFLTFVCHTYQLSLAHSEGFQDTAWIELGESGSSQGKVENPRGIY